MKRNRRFSIGALAAALAALTALVGVAFAAPPVKGTPGDDVLNGTPGPDKIRALAGNDTINALGGFNVIWAGDGNDTINGGDNRDFVRAGKGDDTTYGGPGRDRIFAERGVDTTYGGDGNDDLWAMAHKDVDRVANEPADTLNGDNGNDRFHVRDGEADTVNCGLGFDVVFADRKDKVATDCELVRRKGAGWVKRNWKKDNQED